MTNPDVYPVTAEFEQYTQAFLDNCDRTRVSETTLRNGQRLRNIMAGTIGEYEHGTADVDVVFDEEVSDTNFDDQDKPLPEHLRRKALKYYTEVCKDILLTVVSVGDEEEV